MSVPILGSRKTRLERARDWVMSLSPQVKAALIALVGILIGIAGTFCVRTLSIPMEKSKLDIDRMKVAIEKVRAEKELYERLQLLQNQVCSSIPDYVLLRDYQYSDKRNLDGRNKYNAAKAKLVSLIAEYNRIEAKLSVMEVRSPRFFVTPLPPMPVSNLRMDRAKDQTNMVELKWDWQPDPVLLDVANDTKALFEQYGLKFPFDKYRIEK